MADYKKKRKIGLYSEDTRNLQYKLSWERCILSWKDAIVWKYLGDATNDNPNINDIQNVTFFETVDRAYEAEPVEVPIYAEQLEAESMEDLSRFGYISPMSNEYTFKFHTESFSDQYLNRPMIEGDIIEMPFWMQDGEKAYFEVVDVNRKSEFEKFFVTVKGKLMFDKREVDDIPDKNSNEDVMSDIMDEVDDKSDSIVNQSGVDTEEYTVEDAPERDDYDSRNKTQKSFLDDPDAEF